MINSMEDIIELHESSGNIEDAYIRLHLDNKVMILNKYTLRVRRGNAPKEEIREWNNDIYRNVKKSRDLTKEVKEFISLFSLFEKLKYKSGFIKKSETPDFILTRNNKITGIEITKIYIGNDWAKDKLNEEIKEFRLRKSEVDGYMEYKKYNSRVTTYRVRGGLAIMPSMDNISVEDYIAEFKNKIFTKIRKLNDSYQKFDENIIFVEVVSSEFFKDKFDLAQMSEELNFYTSHIEMNLTNTEAKVILKIGKNFVEYDLKNRTYRTF